MSTNAFDSLRTVPLFRDLDNRTLKKISKIADEVDVPAGGMIFRQGQVGKEFVFVLEGTARVEKDGQALNRLFPNEFIGEIALIDKMPRSASIIAETEVRLLVVGSSYFDYLLEITPGLWKEIALALCKYLRAK